ncbi:MAG TPA: hypothetical protein VF600_12405 [Abditibacteriaceae bacterium]
MHRSCKPFPAAVADVTHFMRSLRHTRHTNVVAGQAHPSLSLVVYLVDAVATLAQHQQFVLRPQPTCAGSQC